MQNRHMAYRQVQTYFFFQGYIRQFNTNRIGGAERDRTADPLLAKQVLSQLSYSPNRSDFCQIQPKWWARADSNCRPHAYQACALTT